MLGVFTWRQITITAEDTTTIETYTVNLNRGVTAGYGWKADDDVEALVLARFGRIVTGFPDGIWSDGTTMWVVDGYDEKIYAYRMSDKTRDDSKDFDTLDSANGSPDGIWSDGTTMWVSDSGSEKIFAYRMSDKTRDSARDFNTLSGALNNRPKDIWSDGTTMWVLDEDDDKIYAYRMCHGESTQTDSNRISQFRLKPNTTYYLVTSGGSNLTISLLTSGAVDDGTQDGWTLPGMHFRGGATHAFGPVADDWRFRLDVEGVAVPSGGMHSPHNNPATGAPRIVGAALAAEALTVDTSAIADRDGLRRAVFEYQWLVDGVAALAETGTRFVPVSGDVGKSVTVRVSFTDDRGYAESLTSAAVGPIGAGGLRANTAAVDGATLTLTFNEMLDQTPGGIPPLSAFAVTAGGAPVSVTAVSVLGTKVTLTLGTAVTYGAAVAVDYTRAERGFVRDTLGRTAPSFSGLSAANGAVGAPGPPVALNAAAFSATRIDLSWSAPADDGGAAVTGYRVEASPDGEACRARRRPSSTTTSGRACRRS